MACKLILPLASFDGKEYQSTAFRGKKDAEKHVCQQILQDIELKPPPVSVKTTEATFTSTATKAKQLVLEYCQKARLSTPEFSTISEGESHCPSFISQGKVMN